MFLKFFGDLSIQRKVIAVVMLTTFVALLLSTTALFVFDLLHSRETVARSLGSTANVIASNCSAALEFNDDKAARKILGAFSADPHVRLAVLYSQDGSEFASYISPIEDDLTIPLNSMVARKFKSDWWRLSAMQDVSVGGRDVGAVFLVRDLDDIYDRLTDYTLIVTVVFIFSMVFAFLLSSRLQGYVTKPIMELTRSVQRVARERSYGIRVEKMSDDEVGVLIEQFNNMLEQIQLANTSLQEAYQVSARNVEELARSNNDLERFAYVASHDLLEPLRTIGNFIQLLERRYKGQLDQRADEYISLVVDGAKRMEQLISGLLSYSRVGTRGQPLSATDLKLVLGQVLENLGGLISESHANIAFDELPTVAGDVVQLSQVFQNLLANAIKFRGTNPPDIYVGAKKRDNDWLLWVQDKGIGIDPQYKERIFVIFQRLHKRGEYEGTGIGLAICKRIIERHGGKIWVESTPGEGATFYFTLPFFTASGKVDATLRAA